MSKLSEYLKLIPAAIENREKIFEGIVNNVKYKYNLLSEDEQDEIVRRRAICEGCPFNSKNAKINDDYKSPLAYDHCILCNCALILKTSSMMARCGADTWNTKNPNEPKIPVKWDVYIKNQ